MPGVAGTSCASPTFSGIISLLNDLRLSKGQSTLGFLNPFLVRIALMSSYFEVHLCWQYQNPSIVTDITTGC